MSDPKLKRQGRLSFHMREILSDDSLLEILFDELEEEVQKAGSKEECLAGFTAKMTTTAVNHMARRYAIEIGAARSQTVMQA